MQTCVALYLSLSTWLVGEPFINVIFCLSFSITTPDICLPEKEELLCWYFVIVIFFSLFNDCFLYLSDCNVVIGCNRFFSQVSFREGTPSDQ